MTKREYEVDVFRPEDAPGVAQLFRHVYGDEYPVKTVYDPDRLVESFNNGDHIPIIARTADNKIIGYTAMYRSAPHQGLYEIGLSLVLPEYRRTPIAGLMFRLVNRSTLTFPGIDATFCESVCNHTYTQRAGIMFKYVEMAIEIDLMPAEAYEKEESAAGRVSTVDMFRTFRPGPHAVYVPPVYEEYSRYAFDGFDDSRTVHVSTDGLPLTRRTQLSSQVFEFAQVARITAVDVGADFETVFDTEARRLEEEGCIVIQVWLRLSWPWAGAVADVLRSRGFFLGGILPRWFSEDGLLMQKVLGQPNWDGINLYTDRAVKILDFIGDDFRQTHRTDDDRP